MTATANFAKFITGAMYYDFTGSLLQAISPNWVYDFKTKIVRSLVESDFIESKIHPDQICFTPRKVLTPNTREKFIDVGCSIVFTRECKDVQGRTIPENTTGFVTLIESLQQGKRNTAQIEFVNAENGYTYVYKLEPSLDSDSSDIGFKVVEVPVFVGTVKSKGEFVMVEHDEHYHALEILETNYRNPFESYLVELPNVGRVRIACTPRITKGWCDVSSR